MRRPLLLVGGHDRSRPDTILYVHDHPRPRLLDGNTYAVVNSTATHGSESATTAPVTLERSARAASGPVIGDRLKLARAAAGLSLRGLEDRINKRVTAQAIGKYERNETLPSAGVLAALSQALEVPLDFLFASDEVLTLEAVEFRSRIAFGWRDAGRLQAAVVDRIERYREVEAVLGLSALPWHRPRIARYPVTDLADAERAARSVRSEWNLGLSGIANLVELLEERGIKVLQIGLPDKLAGIAAWVRPPAEPSLPVVVVNQEHPGERQRFTLAHELGHLVLSLEHAGNSEKAADRFAGAFLIPAEALWAEVGKRRTHLGLKELLLLKRLLGASVQTIAYRCLELGIISQAHHRRLFRQFTNKGWRKPPYPELGKLTPERSTRLERLCRRAASENLITDKRAEELL